MQNYKYVLTKNINNISYKKCKNKNTQKKYNHRHLLQQNPIYVNMSQVETESEY